MGKYNKKQHERAGNALAGHALMVVDSTRIRRRALQNCQLARTTFEKAEAELEAFEAKDKPAFVRWHRMEFGSRIEELKKLVNETNSLRQRMERLNRFASMKRCSRREATRIYEQSTEEFERIERALEEQAAKEAERRQEHFEERRKASMGGVLNDLDRFLKQQQRYIKKYLRHGESKQDLLEDLLIFFEKRTGIDLQLCYEALKQPRGEELLCAIGLSGALDDKDDTDRDPDADAFFEEMFGSKKPSASTSTRARDANEARFTTLRRELAFALHPDQSDSGSDPAKLELWHQVQEALANRDLDRLEVLHAHMQVLHGQLSEGTPVSRLISLTAMYRHSRNALRRRIRLLRVNFEWGFSGSSDAHREKLKKSCEERLKRQIEQARHERDMFLSCYEEEFATKSTRSKRPIRAR